MFIRFPIIKNNILQVLVQFQRKKIIFHFSSKSFPLAQREQKENNRMDVLVPSAQVKTNQVKKYFYRDDN